MLAFFGWTDLLIANLVNTKLCYYNNEPADLFVLNLSRVSESLIDEIAQSGLFCNIYRLDDYDLLANNHSKLMIVRKIRLLFSGRRIRRFYYSVLHDAVGDRYYSKFFTGAFWANTLYLYGFFRMSNPNISVSFVEEGIGSYDPARLMQCMLQTRIIEVLLRFFFFFPMYYQAKHVVQALFVYIPEMVYTRHKLSVYVLRSLARSDLLTKILQNYATHVDYSLYKCKDVIFFMAAPREEYEDISHSESIALYRFIANIAGQSRMIIKIHPSDSIILEHAIDTDNKRLFFEALIPKIINDDSVLLVRESSVAMYPSILYGINPHIVFLHRLYSSYRCRGDNDTDIYFDLLKKNHPYPPKLFAPESIEELECIIIKLKGLEVDA